MTLWGFARLSVALASTMIMWDTFYSYLESTMTCTYQVACQLTEPSECGQVRSGNCRDASLHLRGLAEHDHELAGVPRISE